MATTNQQVVYAMATPPGVVQYEYYTQQVPYASAVQYTAGAPPPPPPAADQSDAAAKRSPDEGT